ncbi:histone-lysine N-methyltransferase SETMAR [Trichonephila clavipes]|nr:histone-lysine N-methyltransferase SETMAR [Trichonephila clavipes]
MLQKTVQENSELCIWKKHICFCGDLLEVGAINAMWYCDTLSKLNEAIQKKRPGILKPGILLDDNARPHSTMAMQNHIATIGRELFIHHTVLISHQVTFHLFLTKKKNIS